MEKQHFCPNCGGNKVREGDPHPNGGDLYVAEELESCSEYYDAARPFECSECSQQFYLGAD